MKLTKGQIVKSKNIVTGKEIKCEIVNPKYNEASVEVKILEHFEGAYAIVNHKDIIIGNAIKGSAKIEFGKFEDDEKRFLTIDITTKSNNIENAENLLDKITELMESYENYINFSRCHAEINENTISDGFILEYEHGEMKDKKEYIKDLFKQAKKELNIR